MITKYRADYRTLTVTPVDCSNENQLAVWIYSNGNAYKARKGGAQVDYFDTWSDARDWLVRKANDERAKAYEKYQALKTAREKLTEMMEPQNA